MMGVRRGIHRLGLVAGLLVAACSGGSDKAPEPETARSSSVSGPRGEDGSEPRLPPPIEIELSEVVTSDRGDGILNRNRPRAGSVETVEAAPEINSVTEAFTVDSAVNRYTLSATSDTPTGMTLVLARVSEDGSREIIERDRTNGINRQSVSLSDMSLTAGDYVMVLATDTPVDTTTRIEVSEAPGVRVAATGTKAQPQTIQNDVVGARQGGEVFVQVGDGFQNVVLTFPAGTANLRLYGPGGVVAGEVTGRSPLRMTGLRGKGLVLGIIAKPTKDNSNPDWRLTVEPNRSVDLVAEGAEVLAPETVQLGPHQISTQGWLNQRDSDVWTVPTYDGKAAAYFIDYTGPAATLTARAESGEYSVVQNRATLGPFTAQRDLSLTVSSGSTGPYSLTWREGDADLGQLFEPDGRDDAQIFTSDQRVNGNLYGSSDRDRIIFDLGPDAQMWRIMVVGEDQSTVTSVTLTTPLGTLAKKSRGREEQRKRIRLPDAYIPGGMVAIDVSGQGGDYKVFLKPLGPPPASSEREPNSPVPSRIALGQTYRGILNDNEDGFSFFLEKPATLTLTLQVPPGARYSGGLKTFGYDRPDGSSSLRFEPGDNTHRIELPAGEHQLTLQPIVSSPAEYEFKLDYDLPFAPAASFSAEAPPSYRAFSRFAQQLPLSVSWPGGEPPDVRYSLWSPYAEFTLDSSDGLKLNISADVKAGSRSVWLLASRDGKTVGAVEVTFTSDPGAPLRNPQYVEEIPVSMRGGINVALSALGAEWVERSGYPFGDDGSLPKRNEANALGLSALNDGVSPSEETNGTGSYFANFSRNSEAIYEPTLDLAGDDPVSLAGFVLTDRTRGPNDFSRFTVEASLDGADWTPVLSDTLSEWGERIFFPLRDGPVNARYVRLVPEWTRKSNYMLSEFEVIAVPGQSGLDGIDLAQAALGAMTRGTSGWFYARDFVYGLGPGDGRPTYTAVADQLWSETGLVMTFKNQAMADIEAVRFHYGIPRESDAVRASPRFARILGSVSGPAGPFTERAVVELPKDFGPGSVYKASLPERERMNAIQIEYAAADDEDRLSVPVRYDVIERAESEDYRSVLALGPEFAARSLQDASSDALNPILYSGKGTPIDAVNQTYRGFVEFNKTDNRWFVPYKDGSNTLTLSTVGERGFYPRLAASTPDGAEQIPLEVIDDPASMRRDYIYRIDDSGLIVTLSEPARSTVFLVDQSPSMASFIPQIRRSIIDYSDIMVAGQDRIMFRALGRDWLLDDQWIDDPMVLRRLLLDYQTTGNSDAESGLLSAAERLEGVDGLRSIVIVADADSGPVANLEKALRNSQARIYTIKVSSARLWSNPFASIPLATQWSEMTGGELNYVRLGSDITTAYQRVSARLLGEKHYDISASWETRTIDPGTLVTQFSDPDLGKAESQSDRPAAVHVLFDASGSMLKRTPQGRRVDIAKRSVQAFMDDARFNESQIGLRTFGGAPDQCETDLRLDIRQGSVATFLDALRAITPLNNAKTPIAKALSTLSDDLSSVDGDVRVLLITDGEETCDGNPEAVISRLMDQGFADRVDIVSFALDSGIDRAPYQRWAEAGKGVYIDAQDGEQLTEGLLATQARRFEVWQDGAEIAFGVVGQTTLKLDPGDYQLRSGRFSADFEIRTGEATTVVLTD